MRDRLIELLRQIEFDYSEECVCAFEDGYKGAPDFAKFFVDYLLKNGVIVLPCKVGDTVYVIIDIDNPARRMLECKVISISMEETGMHFQFQTVKKYLYRYGNFDIDDIGKTVFFTREQAEKALAEATNGT